MVIPQDFNYRLRRLNETLQYFIIYFGSERIKGKADKTAMYGVIWSLDKEMLTSIAFYRT